MKFYREPNWDYLAVDPTSAAYYRNLGKNNQLEGRACAIAGRLSSVCTTSIGLDFLKGCTPVERSNVPEDWRRMLEEGK